MNKEEYLKFSKDMVEKTGEELLNIFRSKPPIRRGGGKEIKSISDKVADEMIISFIEERFPNHSYLTEETGMVEKNSDFIWVVDPLDGTRNFVNSNPLFSISLALFNGTQPVLGVVEAPLLKERFWAVIGEGAYHQDLLRGEERRIVSSDLDKPETSYFLYCEGAEKNKERVWSLVERLRKEVGDIRKFGSAALALTWMAAGRVDGYVVTKIRLWDIAAGLMIAKEAGVRVFHFDLSPYTWSEFEDKEGYFDLFALNSSLPLPESSLE